MCFLSAVATFSCAANTAWIFAVSLAQEVSAPEGSAKGLLAPLRHFAAHPDPTLYRSFYKVEVRVMILSPPLLLLSFVCGAQSSSPSRLSSCWRFSYFPGLGIRFDYRDSSQTWSERAPESRDERLGGTMSTL